MITKTIVFIYTSLPGYMFSCIEKLASNSEYKIVLLETETNENYPVKFRSDLFKTYNCSEFDSFLNEIKIREIKKVFVTGWANKRIIKFAKYFFKQNVRLVLFSDQAKKNNIRQKFGKTLLKGYLNKFEKIIVPGKTAYDLMVYYGVPQQKISTGLYTADDNIFNEAKSIRESKSDYPRCFLFDGQYIKRKGVPFLLKEYSEYTRLSNKPWELVMVGKGNLEKTISKKIKNLGFVKQNELKEAYANTGCFVLPSFEDHWPLVVHQAACAGLPLILSPYCGNHFELFKNNINGYFIDPNKKGSLTEVMLKIEKTEVVKLKEMGEVSYQLSKTFSVVNWISNIKHFLKN